MSNETLSKNSFTFSDLNIFGLEQQNFEYLFCFSIYLVVLILVFGLLYFCVTETDEPFDGGEISNEEIFEDALMVQIEESEKVDFFILKENIGEKCNLCTEVWIFCNFCYATINDLISWKLPFSI